MNRFYLEEQKVHSGKAYLRDPETLKYARNILRLEVGFNVELFDGQGKVYSGKILKLTKKFMEVDIHDSKELPQRDRNFILAQALTRGSKLDDVIRMNTEIGVSEFLLFESDFSIIKVDNFNKKKLDRFEKVMIQATRQSENNYIPIISGPEKFEQVLEKDADLKILMHSRKENVTVDLNKIKNEYLGETKDVLVLIGPEGGFSPKEIEMAMSKRFEIAHLNLPILRTETAGAVVSAILLS